MKTGNSVGRVRRGWRQAIAALLGGELVTRTQCDRIRGISHRIEFRVVGFVGCYVDGDPQGQMVDIEVADTSTGEVDHVRLGVGDAYQTRVAAAMRIEELSPLG